jgi:hypothetical protein
MNSEWIKVAAVGDVPDGRVNTSERGEFTLAALPLGNHGVALHCAGAKPELKVLALTEAGEHSVQWDLQGGARLRVAWVDGARVDALEGKKKPAAKPATKPKVKKKKK